MNRCRIIVRTVGACVALLVVAACSKGSPGSGPTSGAPDTSAPPATTAPPATSAPPSPSPTPTTPTVDPALIFAANGIGPYLIGKSLAELNSKGRVTGLFDSPICPGVKIGLATGTYAGKLRLAFGADGKLWYIDTESTTFQTPSGAKVGMTIAKLKSIYGSKGTVIPKTATNIGGLLVTVSGSTLGIVFLEGTAGKAFSMSAGPADVVESFAKGGEGC